MASEPAVSGKCVQIANRRKLGVRSIIETRLGIWTFCFSNQDDMCRLFQRGILADFPKYTFPQISIEFGNSAKSHSGVWKWKKSETSFDLKTQAQPPNELQVPIPFCQLQKCLDD